MTEVVLSRPASRAVAIGFAAPLAFSLLAPAPVRADGATADGSPPGSADAGSPTPSNPPPCAGRLQELVDAAPRGSTVRLPACTSIEAIDVDRPLVIEAHGTVIDGRDTLQHAVVVSADDVEIAGLTVSRVANPAQDGAVRAWDVSRFTFRDGTITDSAGACISVARGADSTIAGSTLARCGQEGIHATLADRLSVRDNRIVGNNPAGAFDPEWEAGGAKVTRSTGVVFEHNEVADNDGPGIWCDIDCRDLVVRDNRVSANSRAGIQVEISDGALVTDNAVWENGWAKSDWGWGAGILVSSSKDVLVDSNVVAWNADGIVIVSQDRDDAPGAITGDRTSGNLVASEAGHETYGEAWLQDWAGGLTDAAAGNGGSSDAFWFTRPEGGDARFAWGRALSRLEAFGATAGGAGATYATDADVAARLGAAGVPEHPGAQHPLGTLGLRDLVGPLVVLVAGVIGILVLVAAALWRRRRTASTREMR